METTEVTDSIKELNSQRIFWLKNKLKELATIQLKEKSLRFEKKGYWYDQGPLVTCYHIIYNRLRNRPPHRGSYELDQEHIGIYTYYLNQCARDLKSKFDLEIPYE